MEGEERIIVTYRIFVVDSPNIIAYTGCINTEGMNMALRQMNVEWKHIISFATEANLMRRIEQDKAMYPDYDDRFIVVRTPEGRWTAVVVLDKSQGGYVGRYAFLKV